MKTLFFLIALCLCVSAPAAITERYVNSAGSGAADGTSEANAMSYATFTDYMTTGGSVNAAAGDRFNVIAGTYSRATTTDTWNQTTGTTTSPIIVRGYTTTIGDGYQGRTGNTGALVTTNMPTINYTTGVLSLSGSFIIVESFQITGARNGAHAASSGTGNVFRACRIANAAAGSAGVALSFTARATAFNCDVTLTNGTNAGTAAVDTSATASRVLYCRITSTARGIQISGGTAHSIIGNLVYGCTGNGVEFTSTSAYASIVSNTIVGGGADGLHFVSGQTGESVVLNNMITDNTGDGIDMAATNTAALLGYQRTRDNASNIANGGDWTTATNYAEVTTDTGGASTDYTNSGANDYTLIATSPATSAGWFYNNSIGAFQRSQTSAGGGGETSSASAQ